MRWFDSLFLIAVSGFLATRSMFSGVLVLVFGLLIQFQLFRIRLLLGGDSTAVPAGRRFRAAALSLALAATLFPMVEEPAGAAAAEMPYHQYLPLVVLVSLFSATMMAGLAVEKRKR